MTEAQFGKGGIKDTYDSRDYLWSEVGHGSMPFDWNKGYNVEDDLGFPLVVKNQGATSACGGFAWSYYGQVLDFLTDKEYQIKSPKFIYAQTYVTGGGSDGRTNCDLVVKQGWGNEIDTPTFPTTGPITETFVENIKDITDIARQNALKDRALFYANVSLDVDILAQAIRDNHGCIFGINGKNNGTWTSAFPLPPDTFSGSWNHWVYVGKVKKINGKKYFGILNSWGGEVGDNGWQWLSEDYINHTINNSPVIWAVWTLVARTNEPTATTPLTKTLRYGTTDPEVKILQGLLKKDNDFPNINTTEYFGLATLGAVKSFQTKRGLVADGIVGPLTRNVLNKI